jgi:predicted metal-dependent hydrolase
VDESPRPPGPTLDEAQRLLDQGRAFSAHEILEARWKSCPEAEREFWQGLAQLCVGITHGQRGNLVGAARLLRRGAARLRDYTGPAYGVDPQSVSAWAEETAAGPASAERHLRLRQ